MECYCVARNKPIRRKITKPQTATVISLWFRGLLTCPELYCDWPVHNQHSWNFSGVHGFLSLTVMPGWKKIIINEWRNQQVTQQQENKMYIIICWPQNAFIQVVTIMMMMVMTMMMMIMMVVLVIMIMMKILIFIITAGIPRTTRITWQYRPPRS